MNSNHNKQVLFFKKFPPTTKLIVFFPCLILSFNISFQGRRSKFSDLMGIFPTHKRCLIMTADEAEMKVALHYPKFFQT